MTVPDITWYIHDVSLENKAKYRMILIDYPREWS